MSNSVKTAFNRCNPDHPIEDYNDPMYVDFTGIGLRGTDTNPIVLLQGNIELSDDPTQQCVTGFRGCGKSTELLRLKNNLEQAGYVVVYIDTEDYLNLTVPADIADLWVTMTAALDEAIFGSSKPDPTQPFSNFWERFQGFLNTSIAVNDGTFKVPVVADFKATFKHELGFRAQLYRELGQRKNEMVRLCRAFAEEAVAYHRKAAPESAGLVVVVDSFEKLRGDLTNASQVRESIDRIFIQQASELRTPFHAIFTVPPWVRFMLSCTGFGSGDIFVIPMCRIFEKPKTAIGAPAKVAEHNLSAFLEILRKRFDTKEVFGDEATLLRLAEAAGGYPRDLLRYVREVLLRAGMSTPLPIPAEDQKRFAEAVLTAHESLYENAILDDVLPMLVRVATEHEVRVKDAPQAERIADLFDYHFVLAYINGEPWFDLHPMVRRTARVQAALSQRAVVTNPSENQ
jgi:hypothetical protein